MQTSQMTRDDWAKMTIQECQDFAMAYAKDAEGEFAQRLAYRAYEAAHAVTSAYNEYRHTAESTKNEAERVLASMENDPTGESVYRAWGYDMRADFDKLEAASRAKREEWNLFYAFVTEQDAKASDVLYDRYPEERATAEADWERKCADPKFVAAVQHVLRHQ